MKMEFYIPERDGVTQGLLATWLACRQRARYFLQAWDSTYHKETLIDGGVGHCALELAYLDIKSGKLKGVPSFQQSRRYLNVVEKRWYAENSRPNAKTLAYVERALALMEGMLPLYFDFWRDDFKKKQWVSLEEKFSMPIKIQWHEDGSEAIVPVRGKKDGVFKTAKGLWLFETKFKAQINEGDIMDTLGFETQVMMYLSQVRESMRKPGVGVNFAYPRGCLYNIVRRASLKPKAGEDTRAFVKRVVKDIETRPDFYFTRIESPTTLQDLVAFNKELRYMVTEFYQWWRGELATYKNTYACIGKYGKCQYLPVCSRNDFGSLVKRKTVFKELESDI